MSSLLEIKGVNKAFGGLNALSDVNLEIEEGGIHAIIGPNGAGKSTLLNCCIGRLIPDTGSVTFNGHNMVGLQPHDINHAGMVRVFQTPEIFPSLSLLMNVMLPAFAQRDGVFKFNPFADLYGEKEIRERAMHELENVGLAHAYKEKAETISRGDKRRLELAMGLVQKPKLLLLDEPTAGMARLDTNKTIDLLLEIKKTGVTKVIIEHDMHVVFSLADKISVLAQGAIIAAGTPEEIKGNPVVIEAYLGGESE